MKQETIDNYEMEIEEAVTIEEGKHEGIINNVSATQTQYVYINIHVLLTDPDIKDKKIKLKLDFPARVTETTGLGMLLKKSGFDLTIGEKINLEVLRKHLTGCKLTFLTQNIETEKGTFANIIKESVKFV